MESPGKYLKAERESQNLTLAQVSKFTKIREPLLQAIENDKYDQFSAPFYVKGFLEAYARCLGLTTDDVIVRYQKFLEDTAPPKGPELERRKTLKKRRVSLWLLLVLALIISFAILVFFFSFNPLEHFLSSRE